MKAVALAVAAVTLTGAAVVRTHVHRAISNSLPVRGAYLVWPARTWPMTEVRRGDLVEACPPVAAAQAARALDYAPSGSCPGDIIPFLKFVAAVGGDTVATSERGVLVDGRPLPNSAPLRLSDGRWLVPPMFGLNVVPAGKVWLYGTNARSYDSRFFGPISVTQVRNEAWARFSEPVPELR